MCRGTLAVYIANVFSTNSREFRARTFSRSKNITLPETVTDYHDSMDFNGVVKAYSEGRENSVKHLNEDEYERRDLTFFRLSAIIRTIISQKRR